MSPAPLEPPDFDTTLDAVLVDVATGREISTHVSTAPDGSVTLRVDEGSGWARVIFRTSAGIDLAWMEVESPVNPGDSVSVVYTPRALDA